MVFHWSLSDSKSLQVSRTLLSILANLNNAVVWMVSTLTLISKSSSLFTNSLVAVPRALLSRASVKGNRKLILVLIQERTLLLVSGRIESSAFSLSLVSCSFFLAFSLVLLPSFFLSLLLVLAFLPSFLTSFLLWVVTRSSGTCTQNKILPFSRYHAYLYVREIS